MNWYQTTRLAFAWAFCLTFSISFADKIVERATPTCSTAIRSSTPVHEICGAEGRETKASPILKTSSADYVSCRGICLQNGPSCISFSYGPGQKCIIYSTRIRDSGFQFVNTGMRYWNRHCFKKTCGLCPDGQVKCGHSCVNLQSDTDHCGSCSEKCPTGATCVSGSCACPTGQKPCSGACVDTSSDSDNCGGCGQSCGDEASCNSGSCTCPSGSALCSGPFGPCQDTNSDPNNCGGCGQSCGDGASCNSGSCTCPTGSALCSGPFGPCQDTESDPNNCGGCGQSCGNGASCANGQCTCPSGSALCSGQFGPCQDTTSDSQNCGGCGQSCGNGASCVDSQCTCPTGSALCSGQFGACQDTTSDSQNCGGCGQACGNGASCVNGQCTCPTGSGLCSGQFGPCQDTTSDSQNCGGCGQACGLHSGCVDSTCECQISQSISNPGFEDGELGPWNFQSLQDFFGDNDATISVPDNPSNAYEGDYYANLGYTGFLENFNFNLSQAVTVCPQTKYTFTVHVNSQLNSAGAQTCFLQFCVNGACSGSYSAPLSWSTFSFGFTSGTGDQATVSVTDTNLGLCERAYLRFDAFSLAPAGS